MTQEELFRLVVASLDTPDDANVSSKHHGAVLYSDIGSIREGRYYLMGANPHGAPHEGGAIRDVLSAPQGTNHFVDEDWRDPRQSFDAIRPQDRVPMQHRMSDLFEAIGAEPKDVLSTNLVFARSPQVKQLDHLNVWQRRCWIVHKKLMEVVRPTWIIALGGFAYEFLKEKGTATTQQKPVGDGQAAWHFYTTMTFAGVEKTVGILNVRHPGKQGFISLGQSLKYPDAVRRFIVESVRVGEPNREGGSR